MSPRPHPESYIYPPPCIDLPVDSVVCDRETFPLTGAQTDGVCFDFGAFVPSRSGSSPYVNTLEDEGFYVVEAEFEFRVVGESTRLTAGDSL